MKLFGNKHEIRVAHNYEMMSIMGLLSDYVDNISVKIDERKTYTITFEMEPIGFDCFIEENDDKLRDDNAIVIK